MIVSGCMGLGIWYRQQFRLRLKCIRTLLGILEMLMSEIGYERATLPECCRRVGERLQEPFRGCLLGIYERMQDNFGESFREVFCERMANCLNGLPLTKEDTEGFLNFVGKDSFEDGRMQIRMLELGREYLQNTAERLERENAEKCRMAVGLGAMSGLLLLLILL